MKLAFIGIGRVGFSLANNLNHKGHEVVVGHNDPTDASVVSALEKNPNFSVLPIQEAVDAADIVFLATPFMLNESILADLNLGGKVLVDCTNPVGPGISHGLKSEVSGAEKVQEWAGNARVVKSYNIYGFENLADSSFPNYDVRPIMLIAGDDAESKAQVQSLNDDLGFETLDVGALNQALHLEHMTLLWVKMVRANGYNPHFTWAKLEK